MTSLSTYSRLWQRLYAKFGLEPQDPNPQRAQLLRTVVPTTDADEGLCLFKVDFVATATIPVSVWSTFRIVPSNERWTIYNLDVSTVSGDRQLDQWAVYDAVSKQRMLITTFTSTTAYKPDYVAGFEIHLEPGWEIQFHTDAAGATDSIFNVNVFRRIDLYNL